MSIESIFLVADCSNAIYQHHFDLSLNKLLAKQKESLYASARLENSASSVRRFKIRHGNLKKKTFLPIKWLCTVLFVCFTFLFFLYVTVFTRLLGLLLQ